MSKILVIDDDRDLLKVVQEWLKFEQYFVDTADSGERCWGFLAAARYDLILLDWELPDTTGIEILRKLRDKGDRTPVLMLTGKQSIDDRATGLDTGADDYLTKPFHMKELSARVRALIRRASGPVSNQLRASCLHLDKNTFSVSKDNQPVKLAPMDFALLEFFMRHPNQVFSSEALIDRVWPTDSAVSSESVRTAIKKLRQKLGDWEGEPIIQTVHSQGYKLHAPEILER